MNHIISYQSEIRTLINQSEITKQTNKNKLTSLIYHHNIILPEMFFNINIYTIRDDVKKPTNQKLSSETFASVRHGELMPTGFLLGVAEGLNNSKLGAIAAGGRISHQATCPY
jgi:hypothetical protein